jgi:hypothetical protein
MTETDKADEVTVEARAFSDIVQDDPLRFQSPQLPGLSPEVADYWWRQIGYVFPLEDPRVFPAIGRDRFEESQLEVLERYTEVARELASSEVLNGKHQVTVGMAGGDEESIEAAFPNGENLRGFSVLFRQFYSDAEVASFDRARKTLGEVAAQFDDGNGDRRLEQLKAWKKAAGRMRGRQLEMLVLERLVNDERAPAGALELHRQTPVHLISLYQYGELIHFGRQRDQLKAVIQAGAFEENWTKMEFLIAVAGLCHLYLGFGVLVETALDDA